MTTTTTTTRRWLTGVCFCIARHPEARGPVFAAMAENWVVYHYYDTRANRYAVSVLELYDDSEHRKNLGVVELMKASVLGKTMNETVSSLAPPPLRILGQSYYLRPAAVAATVTRSSLGLTAKQVLFGTATDQVVAIDKRFLDPRRPVKQTTADQDEGLIQYHEVLPLFPASWVTTTHTVARYASFLFLFFYVVCRVSCVLCLVLCENHSKHE